ncbi:MAG: sporulation initiation factor Spo0A C-terminal domain-containing protein [Ruminococcus sp.]|nr:sporulation initiation factor Spo0A C-terminal domain-containing protein [Ruminococcus sp.]MDE6679019.1 sporulation initiation factor Spo0A C-terminal domain-containing protein [Ruminococcus sp.]
MIILSNKVLIKSQNVICNKIASELSKNLYAVVRSNLSAETLATNNAVIIDTTTEDMDESLEALILSGNPNVKAFVLTSEEELTIYTKNGVLFISEKLGVTNICNLIRHCLDMENYKKQVEKATAKALLYMGFHAHFRGYRYTIDTVYLVIEHPEYINNFKNNIYPRIAEMYGVSSESVERAIRGSIDTAFDKYMNRFEEFFGNAVYKPPITEFITFCAEKIKLEVL